MTSQHVSVKDESKGSEITGRACAYCSSDSQLTAEHVLPDCFQRTFDGINIAKTPDGDKAIHTAQTTRDVCKACNSGPLSRLDNYLCSLNERYFSTIIRPGTCTRFQYDFDQLFRALLKIGYNVARTRDWPLRNFKDAVPYILGKEACPAGFHLFVQLLIPAPASKTDLAVTPGTDEIGPLPCRIDLDDVSSIPGLAFEYSVSFWSYRFFVLRTTLEADRSTRRAGIAKWLKHMKRRGARQLMRRRVAKIYASSLTVLDALDGNPTFRRQLSKARSLKHKLALGSNPGTTAGKDNSPSD